MKIIQKYFVCVNFIPSIDTESKIHVTVLQDTMGRLSIPIGFVW